MRLAVRFAALPLLMALSATVLAQEPDTRFAALEERLLAARTVDLSFHITSEGAFEADLRGSLQILAGQSVQLRADGHFGGQAVELRLRRQGDEYTWGNASGTSTGPAPEQLDEALLIGLTRMGLLHNLAMLTGGAPPDHADGGVREWVIVDRVSAAPDNAAAVGFDITVAGQPSGAATLEIAVEGSPVVRRQTVAFPEGEMRVVERYDAVSIQPLHRALASLDGEWQGRGWHDHGDHVNRFVQTVRARPGLDGELAVLEQKAVDVDDPDRLIHHSVVIYSHAPGSGYVARSYLPGGRERVAVLTVDEHAFSWLGFGGRFTAWVTPSGHYMTVAHSPRGEKFFEMDLAPRDREELGEQPQETTVTESMQEFAARYTAAWNSDDPEQVAACYAPDGSLQVNQSAPAVGRDAVTEVARGFMTAFPDMELLFDGLERVGDRLHYRWTFLGTNTGPGGTGHRVRFSGYEAWIIGEDGLIANSLGHFDEAEYARQLAEGVDDAEGQ